jgi:hypothetical protein
MYSVTVYYESKIAGTPHLPFEIPAGWQWVGRGTEISSRMSDWQIRGESMSGITAVIYQCDNFVAQDRMEQDYEVTVNPLY